MQRNMMLLKKEKSCLILVDVQDKLTPLVQEWEKMVERCQWLLQLATTLNVPYLISEQYPKGLGKTISPLQNFNSQEISIEKCAFSCWGDPIFQEKLKLMNRNQIILIGIETHVCMLQTALDLKSSGFDVFVVVDATGSRFEIDKKYALKRMKQAGVVLITSEMVFFEWVRKAGTPEFKTLSQTFLK